MVTTEILALEADDAQFGKPCPGGRRRECPNRTRFLTVGFTKGGTRWRIPLCQSCASELAQKKALALPAVRA